MNLPPGEMNLLTIGRVVDDVKCSNCEGAGKQLRDVSISDGYQLRIKGQPCGCCHGTGKRRVRVTGWCLYRISVLLKNTKPKSVEVLITTNCLGGIHLDPVGGTRHVSWVEKFRERNDLRNLVNCFLGKVIAAHFALSLIHI